MDIIHYLEPVGNKWEYYPGISEEDTLGNAVSFFKGNVNWFRDFDAEVVLIGAPESRNGLDNRSCSNAPDAIRRYLYGLRSFSKDLKLADAGNIRGKSVNDRYQALKEVTHWFLEKGCVVIIIGGTQDLTFPVFNALAAINDDVNMVVADAMVDLDVSNQDFSSRAWINKILENHKAIINDLSILGLQNYLVSSQQDSLLQTNRYDTIRLGEIRGQGISKTEIPLRDGHLLSIDLRVVKGHYQFSEKVTSPHGLEPHEACQLSRYAGLSDQLKIFGIFEVATGNNIETENEVLGSQMVWHFLDGYINRFGDFPVRSLDEYKYFVVHLEEIGEGLRFYQNPANGRWWMEVPGQTNMKVVACDYEDYRKALRKELPEKWWRYFIKCGDSKIEAEN